jgi:acetyl esterase/lipase
MRNVVPLVAIGCVTTIILGIIVGGIVMIGYGISGYLSKSSGSEQHKNEPNPPAKGLAPKQSLLDARQGVHITRLPVKIKNQIEDAPVEIPDANVVLFDAPLGKLSAYLSKPKNLKGKSPAVVWAHGGFGGIGRVDWDQARAFHDSGCVLMIPSFRAENNNPGQFEMFYGEVDDLLAAITYVAGLPNVDSSRVYVAGHDNGGTLVLLAAVMGANAPGANKARAFFSIAGIPDVQEYFNSVMKKEYLGQEPPFSCHVSNECYLRSASPFAGAIRKPTFYLGSRSDEIESAGAVEMLRNANGRPFHAFTNAANHANIVGPAIKRIGEKIKGDVGLTCNIEFKSDEDYRNMDKYLK